MKQFKFKVIAGLFGLSTLGIANAESASATMQVSTSVLATCTISSTGIGTIPFAPSKTADYVNTNMSISTSCTKGTPYTINVNSGLYKADGSMYFRLKNTTEEEYLNYRLLTVDSGGGTRILTPNTAIPDGSGIGQGISVAPEVRTITMNLNKAQDVKAGNYSDTVTFQIVY